MLEIYVRRVCVERGLPCVMLLANMLGKRICIFICCSLTLVCLRMFMSDKFYCTHECIYVYIYVCTS